MCSRGERKVKRSSENSQLIVKVREVFVAFFDGPNEIAVG